MFIVARPQITEEVVSPIRSRFTIEPLEPGFGYTVGNSLRRTLLHIYCGELVWLARWQGKTETPWPNEEERASVAAIAERLAVTRRERKTFLTKITATDHERVVPYRDSKGRLYRAALGDMILQMLNHSAHHRAQAVNMLRRVNAGLVELDYMYRIRQAAE